MTSGQEMCTTFQGDHHPLLERGSWLKIWFERRSVLLDGCDWLWCKTDLDDRAGECDRIVAFGDCGVPLSGQPPKHPEIPDRSAKR